MLNIIKFLLGLKIEPKSGTAQSDSAGELEVLSSDNKLRYNNGASNSPVVTESHVATLTNKSIDADTNPITNLEVDNLKAGVLNTSTTMATASDTQIPSALAIKTYVDDSVATKDQASEISFAPVGNITATDVQSMGAELDSDLTAHENNTSTHGVTGEIVGTQNTQTLINKTIDADLNTISDLEVDNLKAGVLITDLNDELPDHTTLPSAKATQTIVASGLQTVTTNLNNHTSVLKVGAHQANNISVTPAGNLTSTDGQAAFVELQTDIDTNSSSIAAHIADASDAHDASAISVVPSGNLTSTDGQSAFVELQTEIDTRVVKAASSTDNAIARFDSTTGALLQNSVVTISDTGAISGATGVSASSGTLTLTPGASSYIDLNGNVVLGSGKSFAAAPVDNNGIGPAITPNGKNIRLINAGLTSIDTIVAEAYGKEINLINRTGNDIIINNDTGASVSERIYTGTGGSVTLKNNGAFSFVYDGTTSRWNVIGGTGSGTGSSQNLDTIFQLSGSELLTTWTTGNNASFLGGGTISGTFAFETTTPLSGIQSYKFTQAAGSLNDYFASAAQSVPVRFRGNVATLYFPYLYNGTNSDIEPIVYDVTNSAKLTSTTNLLTPTGTNTSIYKVNVTIPITCTQIRIGFQVKALNSGKVLQFDDVQLTSDATVYAELSTPDSSVRLDTHAGYGSTNNKISRFTNTRQSIGTDILYQDSATLGASFTILSSGIYSLSYSCEQDSATVGGIGFSLNSSQLTTDIISINVQDRLAFCLQTTSSGRPSTSWTGYLASGDIVRPHTSGGAVSATSQCNFTISKIGKTSTNIITANESFSTDTASLTYASSSQYTLATLANAPVGTFITFTYAASTNTRTQTTTAPTQTTADMNVNGILLYTRAYAAASTAGNPACIAIQIGKGLKGCDVRLYKDTSKSIAGALDFFSFDNNAGQQGVRYKDYNSATGVILFDAGICVSSVTTSNNFSFNDLTGQTSGYLVINASKSPALTGVPLLQPRIATISDVKTSGTAGGTSTTGTFATRTLNTIVDPTGIVTSLTSNQFTLSAGEYYIEASVPSYRSNRAKAKLRNITDSTDELISSSEYSVNTVDSSQAKNLINGKITLSTAKVFEIQQYTQNSFATQGYGTETSSGLSEVYTIVKITRIK